jgi:MATE family multidrug resistance protein
MSSVALAPEPVAVDSTPGDRARLWTRPTWRGEAGMRHLLVLGFPLILSALSGALNLFFDRQMLALYNRDLHMAAALSSGVFWWWSQQLFMGIVAYSATFVSQYHGAKRPERIGASLWQGLYLAIAGGVLYLLTIPLWQPLFSWMRPTQAQATLEATYCQVLSVGSLFLLANAALSGFFSGRGRTKLVMAVNFLIAGVNIVLNLWFIFNPPRWLPFVEPGLVGAGWATILSFALGTAVFASVAFNKRNDAEFGTRRQWRLDPGLLRRLVRFGFPQSVQYTLDMTAITIFIQAVSHIDRDALTALTMSFSVEMLAFIPMFGFSQSVSILVGQFMGARRGDLAERATCAGWVVSLTYMATIALTFVLFPEAYLSLFLREGETIEQLGRVGDLSRIFLACVAIYALADAVGLVFSGVLKGAGDTRFILWVSGLNGLFLMIIPSLLAVAFQWPVFVVWCFFMAFIFTFAVCFTLRYRSGKWKSIQVIEHHELPEPDIDVKL